MHPEVVIVRLGELTLKGKNRHRFEKRVLDQLQTLLSTYPQLEFKQEFGRIHIELNGAPYPPVERSLNKVFGLNSFSPAYKAPMDLDGIRNKALELLRHTLGDKPGTFKVVPKRANKSFPYDSMDLARLVGGYLLENIPGLSVDVHHPQTQLWVDVREQDAYVFTEVRQGTGGYPIGTNGRGMLLLSGGIDSPVAGWLTMRMGLEVEAVHFHSYPYTSERAKQKVVELAKLLSQYSGSLVLHLVPFTDIQVKLKESAKENLLVISMKRAMLRIAERIAERRGGGAIVTGESLGQVASQTLTSLDVIGRAASLPILRPLITMDKAEIIKVAEKIESYPISIQPYEDCCTIFLPKAPATNPSLKTVEQMERYMDWMEEAIDKAVAGTERIRVRWDDKEETDSYF